MMSDIEYVPVRFLNEYVYCPRLAYIEWVENLFEDNEYTLNGKRLHKRVDKEGDELPEPSNNIEDYEKLHVKSVLMSAQKEKLIARIDLIEFEDGYAIPVDYKRGKKPDNKEGVRIEDKVQCCAQGIILRENGYKCDRGIIYYASSKERVEVKHDEELISYTRKTVQELLECVNSLKIPKPLEYSYKCKGCSLISICLPDEVLYMSEEIKEGEKVRRLFPARDDALPLYVQKQGSYVGINGEEVIVRESGEEKARVKLIAMSQVCLFGNIGISSQAIRACCEHSIPIFHYSYGGWSYGITQGFGVRNAEIKRLQFLLAEDKEFCLNISKNIIYGKIKNQRTIIRRNHNSPPKKELNELAQAANKSLEVESQEQLLGVEGMAARLYFSCFKDLIKKPKDTSLFDFNFEGRNKRPPTDPINAVLSFVYALLVKDCMIALFSSGFDPYMGFYHKPRFGRPALALDLMEQFRPVIADSVVLLAFNNNIIDSSHFIKIGKSVLLNEKGRKAIIETYERRVDTLITHPIFKYKISMRRVIEVQSRLLSRYIRGELKNFPMYLIR